jgi:hypothetical protein
MQSTVSPPKPGGLLLVSLHRPPAAIPAFHRDTGILSGWGARNPPTHSACQQAWRPGSEGGRGEARGGLLRSCKVSSFEFACRRLHKVCGASSACCDWPCSPSCPPSLPPHHAARAGTCHMALVAQPYQHRAPKYATPWLLPLRRSGTLGTAPFLKCIIRLGQSVMH